MEGLAAYEAALLHLMHILRYMLTSASVGGLGVNALGLWKAGCATPTGACYGALIGWPHSVGCPSMYKEDW